MAKIFQINTADNVVVAVEPLTKGEKLELNGNTYIAQSDIPAGHKMAIKAIAQGENVIKYGFPIGSAKEAVTAGAWLHTHNV